mmetsp:Transcript_27310/g.55901  ORF Transcript_27310/g.55901 Transcript_27310/m.55901 type:complete len:241 (+) Transcript_27310:937-1659(+)
MVALTTFCDGNDDDGDDGHGAHDGDGQGQEQRRRGRPGANPNWDTGQVQSECIERLQQGDFPPEVVNVATAATRFFDLGVDFQNPLVPWSRTAEATNGARAVLIGDAAHAMPPFLGQGANQAIQDAYCLSNELCKAAPGAGGGGDVLGKALSDFERQRKPATTLLMLEVGNCRPSSGVIVAVAVASHLGGDRRIIILRHHFYIFLCPVTADVNLYKWFNLKCMCDTLHFVLQFTSTPTLF